ncbi:hypothetical protein GCM10020001_011840 [Nonomuraea salmonea]
MDGLRVHGLRLDGLRVHGLRLDGLRVHGLRLDGLCVHGLRVSGGRQEPGQEKEQRGRQPSTHDAPLPSRLTLAAPGQPGTAPRRDQAGRG